MSGGEAERGHRAAPAWQPIETAPKDGTPMLLFGRSEYDTGFYEDGEKAVQIGFFEPGGSWRLELWDPYEAVIWFKPTHWMPLPAAPDAEELAV